MCHSLSSYFHHDAWVLLNCLSVQFGKPMVHHPIVLVWPNHSWTCCKSTGLPSNTSCTFPWKIWKSPSSEVSFSPWIPAMFQGDDWDDSDLCWVPDPKPLASGIPRPRVPLVCGLGKISQISWTSEGNTAIFVFLIGGLEHLDYFFHILGISWSQLTNFIIFQRGRSTTNHVCLLIF